MLNTWNLKCEKGPVLIFFFLNFRSPATCDVFTLSPAMCDVCLLYPQQRVMCVYFQSPVCDVCLLSVPSNVWCLFSFSTQQHVMCDWFIPVNPNCCLMCCHGFYFCVHLPFDFIHVAKCSHFCIYPKCVWVGLEWNR